MIVGSASLFVIPTQSLYWFLVINLLGSVEVLIPTSMNYIMARDATFVLATLTVVGLGVVYAKDSYADVKSFFTKCATTVE